MEPWLAGGSHYGAHQGTEWIPVLFKRLSRNKMQVTAQGWGILHHCSWGVFFVGNLQPLKWVGAGGGSLANKIWSYSDKMSLPGYTSEGAGKQGASALKVALVALVWESFLSSPLGVVVTSARWAQHGGQVCFQHMPGVLGHPSARGRGWSIVEESLYCFFLAQAWYPFLCPHKDVALVLKPTTITTSVCHCCSYCASWQ